MLTLCVIDNIATGALFKPGQKWSETMVLGQFRHISVETWSLMLRVIDNIATGNTFQTWSEMVRNGQKRWF